MPSTSIRSRLEALEADLPPPGGPSPWFAAAADTLTEEERTLCMELLQFADTGRIRQATPAHWAALKTLADREAEGMAAAGKSGQRSDEFTLMSETYEELWSQR